MLPRRAAIPSEVLGVPACDIMTEHAQLAAPLAEPDTQLNPEPGAGEPLTYTLWPPEPDERPRGFDADQTQQLYLQLNHHCQMMIETYALTACNKDHQEAAVTLANLLAEYQVGTCSIVLLRQPGDAAAFGVYIKRKKKRRDCSFRH